jgi:Signal transduction histidine kinase
MFKRLQLKMTLYYSLILIAILTATNLSIYYVMVNYNNYQMSSEISRMLDSIKGSEWLYMATEESRITNQIIGLPKTLISSSNDSSKSEDDDEIEIESHDEIDDDHPETSNSETPNSETPNEELPIILPEVKDLIIPKTLDTFSIYMIFDQSDQLITWKSSDDILFDKLLTKSKTLRIYDDPSIITLEDQKKSYYLMAKMPIEINTQTLGYYVVARDVTIAYQTLENLSKILVFSLIAGVFVSAGLGYLIAGRSLRPIKEAYTSKQEFLANASHELKTPLSVILLSTETLEGEIDPELAFQRQVVSGIKDEAQKMNHLVSQLLFLSRTDSSTATAKYEHFNLSEALSKELNAYEKIAQAKGIQLSQTITPGLKINGDRKQLLSVFSILIDNAIKYSKDSGQVYVSLEKNNDLKRQGVRITVKDTGIGMPEDELKHIFERFYRLESSRSKETGGYGLGLAIAKEIIDQHKGIIQVNSIEKVGTTFVVEL